MLKAIALSVTISLFLCGCNGRPYNQNTGGSASVAPALVSNASIGEIKPPADDSIGKVNPHGMPSVSIKQPDNPNSTSTQNVDYEYEEVIESPLDTVKETTTLYPDGRSITVREPIPAGTRIVKRSKSKIEQELGGSWYDKAKELAAELKSFAPVQYVGILLLIGAAVGYFHPVVRVAIGGKDMAMALAGVASVMMFGPFLFVKYSNYFFLAIILAGIYWGVARFKYQHGKLDALESEQQK